VENKEPTGLLEQIENSMRAAGRHERNAVKLDAFELFIAEGALDHLSFAVPLLPNPDDWAPQVAALTETFVKWGKRPRLEYIEELHPGLVQALEQGGLHCEMRAPIMVLDLAALPAAEQQQPAGYQSLDPDDEASLRRYLLRQSFAFGGVEDDGALDWLRSLRSGLRSGQVMAAGLVRERTFVTGAVIQIGEGLGELAGVWTDPLLRRQGLAYTLCRRLLSEYAGAGYALCWLSAAEGAQRLYEKLGFVRRGVQLNYGRPSH
jgi:ribosomal protein S18 acetylase RimI-like enzyme